MNYFNQKITKFLYVISLFFILTTLFAQQKKSSIKGTITTENGKPAEFANVELKGTNKGAESDENGQYKIENIKQGTYTIVISGIGFKKKSQTIEINASQNYYVINFTVEENVGQLNEIVVKNGKDRSYRNEISTLALKSPVALKDTPQSITYVTKELIQDQQAFRITDVIKNVSGINQESITGDYTIRGFGTGNNVMINGLRINKGWTPELISNMERIEVIKGANSALYGYSDPGGTINRVTKKPLAESHQGISFSAGSYSTLRAEADFTGPLNKDLTLLYRINLAYQDAGSFRALQEGKDILFAPSVSFIPSNKTRIDVDLVYNSINKRVDRGQPLMGNIPGQSILESTPISLISTYSNSYNKEQGLSLMAAISHKFSDKIIFNTSFINHKYDRDYMEHRANNAYGVDAKGKEIPTLMDMRFQNGITKNNSFNMMNYLNIAVKTGPAEHKIVVGYDYVRLFTPNGGYSTALTGGFRNAANTKAIATYDPTKPNLYLLDSKGNPVPNMPYFDLTNPNYAPQDPSTYFTKVTPTASTLYYSSGVYLQDHIKLGKLQMLFGLRQEFYTDFQNYEKANEKKVKQTAFIPRLGLVYSVLENINAYVTYVEGFQPQSAAIIGDPTIYGGPFDPLISNLKEGGLKSEWFNKKLSINTSIYRIELNNVLVNALDTANPELLEQRGQEVSKGVEFDAVGQIMPNLMINANYAYNNTIITESDDPELVGTGKEFAPHHMGGAWIKYNFINKKLSGLALSMGGRFVTDQTTSQYGDLTLPGYTVFDGAISYTKKKVQLSLNLNNLDNERYWIGRGRSSVTVNPGTPRNIMFRIGYTL